MSRIPRGHRNCVIRSMAFFILACLPSSLWALSPAPPESIDDATDIVTGHVEGVFVDQSKLEFQRERTHSPPSEGPPVPAPIPWPSSGIPRPSSGLGTRLVEVRVVSVERSSDLNKGDLIYIYVRRHPPVPPEGCSMALHPLRTASRRLAQF